MTQPEEHDSHVEAYLIAKLEAMGFKVVFNEPTTDHETKGEA